MPRRANTVNLDELRKVAADKKRIDRRIVELIHVGRREGASLRAIAEASGFSFQRIHQIVKNDEPAPDPQAAASG
jgi:hypothetical protein